MLVRIPELHDGFTLQTGDFLTFDRQRLVNPPVNIQDDVRPF